MQTKEQRYRAELSKTLPYSQRAAARKLALLEAKELQLGVKPPQSAKYIPPFLAREVYVGVIEPAECVRRMGL